MNKLRLKGAVSQEPCINTDFIDLSVNRPPVKLALPPPDNMGVNNAGRQPQKGYGIHEVRLCGKPEDYFYHLCPDTLQVSVKGNWASADASYALLEKREFVKFVHEQGLGSDRLLTHDGCELQIFPHGGRPAYQILLKDGDGLEIRALPSDKTPNMPPFILRFGARWCVENTVEQLQEWTTEYLKKLGFVATKIQLSELHVRCDIPTPFVDADTKRIRGTGSRNGRFNVHLNKGKLSGIDNLGGTKHVKFNIYDKRLEQEQKEGVFWPMVWDSFGIDRNCPIWRIEARFDRTALNQLGYDALQDLTPDAQRAAWGWFTQQFLLFVSETGKRTDRTEPSKKWAKVQASGELVNAKPIVSKIEVTATQLFKQATGCLASGMAKIGVNYAEGEMVELLEQALTVSEDRFEQQREEYIRLALLNVIRRFNRDKEPSLQKVKDQVEQMIEPALLKRIVARPFTEMEEVLDVEGL